MLNISSEHPDRQPTIVVRLKELLFSVVQLNVKAACFGGSHQYYYDRLDAFMQAFTSLGVQFVFFGGYVGGPDRCAKRMARGDREYKKYSQIMRNIDDTNEIKSGVRSEVRMLLGLYEEGLAKKYGEYRYAGDNLNQAIVSYVRANNENVVAVMAKDSDFLVYDLGEALYWGCGIEHLNFKDMTTYAYSRRAILEHLQLTPYQYHVMVAVLAVIQDDTRKHYGRTQFGKAVKKAKAPNQQKMYDLSECVRKCVAPETQAPHFAALAYDMFSTRIEEYCAAIKMQFDKYKSDVVVDDNGNFAAIDEKGAALDPNGNVTDGVKPDSEPAIDAALIRRAFIKNRSIHAILTDEIIVADVNFIDLGRWNHPNAAAYSSLFVIVFKRAMGMVLKSKRGNSHDELRRRFMMKPRDCERFKVLNKTLLYPECEYYPSKCYISFSF